MYRSYTEMLKNYLENNSEKALYYAHKFSKQMIEKKLSPEEMVSIHLSVFKEVVGELPKEVLDSFDLLLEVMVGYGLAYREYLSLRDRQSKIDSEINLARKMQQSLLPHKNLQLENVDFGVVSIPAGKMSGDYYYYDLDEHGNLIVCIADIVGKGIPAAMSMSMIKYAIDGLPELRLQPSLLLENVNRVVERNIGKNMFITMIYGSYDTKEHRFYYSNAGHEPSFIYKHGTHSYTDLFAKGLVLGVSPNVRYSENMVELEAGDFIVLLSDGVTECRINDEFITRDQIMHMIVKYINEPAQAMVEKVYKDLEKMQDFTLKDDFTLIILRRKCFKEEKRG